MNFTQSFKLALKSLKTSKMRAFLTMLGIIIGVGAVIVILSLGNGMTNMMNSQFEKMGSNLIQVMTYGRGTGGTRDVDVEDLYELVDKYPQYLTGVTPYVSASAKVRYQTDDYDRTSVYGVSEAFFKEDTKGTMQGETLAEGRFLSYIDVDRHQNVCVIGDYLAQAAFRGDALGKTISLSGVPYTVIGVLSKSGDSSEGSADDVIYIPYENAQRMGTGTMMMGTDEMFLLTSTSRDTASAAKGIVEKRLYKTYQSSDYYMVMTSAEMMDAMNTMMNTMMIVLVAIAMFGSAFYLTLMWALVADCIDYQERRTGRREESSIYATYSLFRKIAQGVGAAVVSWAIGMTGYDQKLGALEQAAGVPEKIYFVTAFLPFIGALISLISMHFLYNLDDNAQEKVK